jgi:alpha-ketoglutarate-dependent taurine dioxygenase
MLETDIVGKMAWTASSVADEDWRIPLSEECVLEMRTLVERLRANPLPITLLDAADYDLDFSREIAQAVRRNLDTGIGFAIVDHFPIDRLTVEEAKALYWLFSNLISRVVAGAWDGRMLHDVVDTDQKLNLQVRGDLTNQEINWHTDNGFSCTPDYFALLCIRPAKEGGKNSFASLHSAHNLMRARHPDLLPRLYRNFYWNRMGEHHRDDEPVNQFPYFEYSDGVLKGRFNRRIVYDGYKLAGKPLDDEGRAAIETFSEILNDPSLPVSTTLGSGQAVFVNNRVVVHHRTPFIDAEEPQDRRHLVRIYMRDQGPRSYLGAEGRARPPAVP